MSILQLPVEFIFKPIEKPTTNSRVQVGFSVTSPVTTKSLVTVAMLSRGQ